MFDVEGDSCMEANVIRWSHFVYHLKKLKKDFHN